MATVPGDRPPLSDPPQAPAGSGESLWPWYLGLILFCLVLMLSDQAVAYAFRARAITRFQDTLTRMLIYLLLGTGIVLFSASLQLRRLRLLLIGAAILSMVARVLDWTASIPALNEVPLLGDSGVVNAVTRRIASRVGFAILLAGFALCILELNRLNRQLRDANAALRDAIAQRQRLETQLIQAQKLSAIGELAGGVAHNFNNLLTIILGNVDLLRHQAPPRMRHNLEEALAASDRAADLVRQLLTFSRQIPVALRPLALRPLLEEVAGMVRQTFDRRIAIHVEFAPGVPFVLADQSQVHQVLLNLCLNARDALLEVARREAGRPLQIRLEVEPWVVPESEAKKCLCGSRTTGSFVRVRVVDNGVGMTSEVREKMFDPFFTTKEVGKGTGLGLSTVHGIVTQHGGWIEVDSEPGKGSSFAIHLPACEPSVEAKQKAAATLPRGGSETILLADDDESVRLVTELMLTAAGYRVVVAEDGQAAVAVHQEQVRAIDLAVLDVSMPGLSGAQALLRMRERQAGLKAVFLSGYAEDEAVAAGKLGSAFLAKPYAAAELLAVVRRVLDE